MNTYARLDGNDVVTVRCIEHLQMRPGVSFVRLAPNDGRPCVVCQREKEARP